jgi:hypothetical protein
MGLTRPGASLIAFHNMGLPRENLHLIALGATIGSRLHSWRSSAIWRAGNKYSRPLDGKRRWVIAKARMIIASHRWHGWLHRDGEPSYLPTVRGFSSGPLTTGTTAAVRRASVSCGGPLPCPMPPAITNVGRINVMSTS